MGDDTNKSNEIVFPEIYKNVYSTFWKLTTSLIGLWALAYVLGWIRTHAYYISLKAEQLLPELTTTHMAGSSIWPILAVVLGLYFAFSDFSKYLGENLKWLHRITSLVAFINIAAAQIASHYFNIMQYHLRYVSLAYYQFRHYQVINQDGLPSKYQIGIISGVVKI